MFLTGLPSQAKGVPQAGFSRVWGVKVGSSIRKENQTSIGDERESLQASPKRMSSKETRTSILRLSKKFLPNPTVWLLLLGWRNLSFGLRGPRSRLSRGESSMWGGNPLRTTDATPIPS